MKNIEDQELEMTEGGVASPVRELLQPEEEIAVRQALYPIFKGFHVDPAWVNILTRTIRNDPTIRGLFADWIAALQDSPATPTWTPTRELRIEQGPVVIAQTRSDPGDMGEPRKFRSEGVTYVTVRWHQASPATGEGLLAPDRLLAVVRYFANEFLAPDDSGHWGLPVTVLTNETEAFNDIFEIEQTLTAARLATTLDPGEAGRDAE